MRMQQLISIIFGFIAIIIILAMGLNIQTTNATIQSANQTNLVGLSVLDDWGAPLIILGLLATAGLFVYGGIKGVGTGSAGMGELMGSISMSIIAVVALSFIPTIILGSNNLIGAVTTDPEDVIWGVIPLLSYVACIGLAANRVVTEAYRKIKGGKGKAAAQGGFA